MESRRLKEIADELERVMRSRRFAELVAPLVLKEERRALAALAASPTPPPHPKS